MINYIDKRSIRKASIEFVFWVTLMKDVLIKCSKLRKEKYKIYGSSNKRKPGSTMQVNPMFEVIQRLREW